MIAVSDTNAPETRRLDDLGGTCDAHRCQWCGDRRDHHKIGDGSCPPSDGRKFPRLTRVKDPDRALARYWAAGPGTIYLPR